jgi:hypothetical protein
MRSLNGFEADVRSRGDARVMTLRLQWLRHSETAAGLFGVIKAIEMLRRRTYLPTGGLKKPRTDFDWGVRHMTHSYPLR